MYIYIIIYIGPLDGPRTFKWLCKLIIVRHASSASAGDYYYYYYYYY